VRVVKSMNSEKHAFNQICITLDIDWACDEILWPVIEMMEEANVKATLFATNYSQLLDNLTADQFEIGLHLNFIPVEDDFRRPIQELKALYPDAKGTRSHSLFVSSHILQLCRENGLRYESNIFLPYHEALHPVMRFRNFVSIPFYWSDDQHLSMRDSFKLGDLALKIRGLKVFNFHPIHVFMNTSSEKHYKSYKSYYHDVDKLRQFVNFQDEGIGTLFRSLLDYLVRTRKSTYTLYEINKQYTTDHE